MKKKEKGTPEDAPVTNEIEDLQIWDKGTKILEDYKIFIGFRPEVIPPFLFLELS